MQRKNVAQNYNSRSMVSDGRQTAAPPGGSDRAVLQLGKQSRRVRTGGSRGAPSEVSPVDRPVSSSIHCQGAPPVVT